MSNYFIWEDLVGKYRKLSLDYDATNVNCIWAPLVCADIDALVGKNYSTPFTPTPLFIKNLAIDLCYWQITYKEQDQSILKEYIDERVMGVLNGTITLSDASGNQIPQASKVFMTTSGDLTSFGMDEVTNFAVDSMWQQEFRDDRGQFGEL